MPFSYHDIPEVWLAEIEQEARIAGDQIRLEYVRLYRATDTLEDHRIDALGWLEARYLQEEGLLSLSGNLYPEDRTERKRIVEVCNMYLAAMRGEVHVAGPRAFPEAASPEVARAARQRLVKEINPEDLLARVDALRRANEIYREIGQ